MEKVYCDLCNTKREYKIKEQAINEYKGCKVDVIERVAFCGVCNQELIVEELERENLKILYDKYREMMNIVSDEEIKEFRNKYSLTEKDFAEIANISELKVKRYEKGALQLGEDIDKIKNAIKLYEKNKK